VSRSTLAAPVAKNFLLILKRLRGAGCQGWDDHHQHRAFALLQALFQFIQLQAQKMLIVAAAVFHHHRF